jgi:hypothetical protein
MVVPMATRDGWQARLGRAEEILAEADRLLQRRRTELGGPGHVEFEDRLLQGVRELAAVVRDLAATGGEMTPVSTSHAAELAETATNLARPTAGPRRPRCGHAPQG